ncbi:MAG: hypothetical protein J0M12_16425 [Deltaproteobacteria bacterium]|nr:hypothetical protein [Deltaproteobacteria bacterium]
MENPQKNLFAHARAALRHEDAALLVFSILFLVWHLGSVASERPLAGWDLTSHFYLVTKMWEFLKQGQLSGYDYNWYGGCPLFVLYPPLFFVAALLPHIFSFGYIPLLLAFNLFLFFLPLFFLLATYVTARICFSRAIASWTLFFGLLFLALPRETAHYSLGLLDLFAIGLPASFMATALLALLIGTLERLRVSATPQNVALVCLTTTAIILTHIPLSMFAFWFTALFFLFRENAPRKQILVASLGSLLLTSWWILPFVESFPYSSGVTLGLPGVIPDPFLVLFPNVFDPEVIKTFSLRPRYFYLGGEQHGFLVSLPLILLTFPYQGVFFLICTCAGVLVSIRQRRYFFPGVYLASLLLLPRNILTEIFREGMHTYRFTQPVFLLQIFLSAVGAQAIIESLRQRVHKRPFALLSRATLGFASIALVIVSFYQFSMEPQGGTFKDPLRQQPRRDLTFSLHLDQYRSAADAAKVIAYLGTQHPTGRIAVDTGESLFRALGSSHFFSSQIPLQLNLPVLPGLLAESALSASFINPTMFGLTNVPGWSDYLLWGRTNMAGFEPFRSSGPQAMLRRLRLYGVEYIITALQSSTRALESLPQVVLEFRSGMYSVFRLRNANSLILESTSKPMLFIERGGLKFREFAELWYSDARLIDCPVVHSVRSSNTVPLADLDNFGGFIVSWGGLSQPTQSDYDEWARFDRPVIFLNAAPDELNLRSPNIHFVPNLSPWVGLRLFTRHFASLNACSAWSPVRTAKIETGTIEFSSDIFTLVNFSFHPDWHSTSPTQEVYWATPSMMGVFGQGANTLHFR